MSSNPKLLGLATEMLLRGRQAPRVDLNCGCPANTVTGNGAGSRCVRRQNSVSGHAILNCRDRRKGSGWRVLAVLEPSRILMVLARI